MNIILLGGPGSGKGTLSKRLVLHRGFTHISTGDILRKEKADGTEIGKELSKLGTGVFAGDEMMNRIIDEQIENTKVPRIFDGFPRNEMQAQFLDNILGPYPVFFLDVSEDTLITRLVQRGKTSGREDDQNIEVIKRRLDWFRNETYPLVMHYEKKKWLHVINGEASPEQVFAEVNSLL